MSLKSALKQDKTQYRYDLKNIQNWDLIIDNLTMLLLKKDFRNCQNINVNPTFKSRNLLEMKFAFTFKNGSVKEYVLLFDVVGCREMGYNSDISKVWRDCLSYNFDANYIAYANTKLKQIEELEQSAKF